MGDFVNPVLDFYDQPPDWAVSEAEKELGDAAGWDAIRAYAWDLVAVRGDD